MKKKLSISKKRLSPTALGQAKGGASVVCIGTTSACRGSGVPKNPTDECV